MASTPSNPRTSFLANAGPLKSTPTNSPFARTPRSPNKPRSLYESGLSLKRIIGATVTSPTSFDTLHKECVFAYTAGAAAVVVNAEEGGKYTQRFFRARPTAIPQSANNQSSNAPSTPTNTANEARNRSVATLRDSGFPYSPSTPSIGLDWGDSPGSKTWTSRERIKAATCLSLSRDGKFLAVGETGYSPRVLIFSLHDGSSDVPVAILNEHTYGVRAVSFSPDGRYLASIGHPNDGYLYVWAVNPRTGSAKLHSSNKCTSNIRQMIWLGKSVVTIGTRHIKTWKVEENRSVSPTKRRYNLDGTPVPMQIQPLVKTLVGRNVLLGPLVEAVFTTTVAISDHKAIVCTDRGDMCLLDDNDGHKLIKLGNLGFPIVCLAIDTQNQQVKIGGLEGKLKSMELDALLTPMTPPESPVPAGELVSNAGNICAMGYMKDRLVTIDTKHSVEVSSSELDEVENSPQSHIPFTAHGDSVLGVRLLGQNELGSTFLTWSADGTIMFWDLDGNSKGMMKVTVEQLPCAGDEDPVNQCNVVRPSRDCSFLVTGDRYGVLRVLDTRSKECLFEARAHASDIQDIAIHELPDRILVASCGRDRTIQLFKKEQTGWNLMQTLDEHTSSVCGVTFTKGGEKLLSCSADRTVHIRQVVTRGINNEDMVVAIPDRIITVKTSPLSMVLGVGEQEGLLMVSQLDRSVSTFELSSGKLVNSFRATDHDSTDAVALDGLQLCLQSEVPGTGRPTILAGFSSTDKSIRVYDASTGSFLDREWGHTAAVTSIALLEHSDSTQKTIISAGSDGTIMIWELSASSSLFGEAMDTTGDSRDLSPPKDTPSVRMPLRRVLSRSELSEFQRISPVSTPTGRSSPPRVMRRKTSRYGLSSQSPALAPPMPSLTASKHLHTSSDDSVISRKKSLGRLRTRSRSPPVSPRTKEREKNVSRRPSLASLNSENGGSLRGRTKSSPNFSEFGSLNMSTEQTCRQLRAYRKKLLSNESVREDALAELEQELRLTAAAVADRSAKNKVTDEGAITEDVLRGVLDKYSERLVSLFDERLRLGKVDSFDSIAEDGSIIMEDEVNEENLSPTTGNPLGLKIEVENQDPENKNNSGKSSEEAEVNADSGKENDKPRNVSGVNITV